MLQTKKLLVLITSLTFVSLFILSATPSSAFASSSRHAPDPQIQMSQSKSVLYVSGGGCAKIYTIINLYSCVSYGNNIIVPDAYISPGRSDYSNYNNCNLTIYLYDITAGTKTTGFANCTSPLRQNYQGHYYGKSVAAAGGHAYYTQVIATYTYRGTGYSTDLNSPTLYA